jgi:hypothetical protein
MLSELKTFVEASGATKLTAQNLHPYADLRTEQYAATTMQTAQFGAAAMGRGVYGENFQKRTIAKAKVGAASMKDSCFGKQSGGYGIFVDVAPTIKWGSIIGLKTFTIAAGTSTTTTTVTYNNDADDVAGAVVTHFGGTWSNIRVLWAPIATGVYEQWLAGSGTARQVSMRVVKSTVSATAFNVVALRRLPTTQAVTNAPADETYAFKWRVSFKYS